MRSLLLAVFAAMFALVIGCSAPDAEAEAGESSSEALTERPCRLSRADILASVDADRRTAIARGFRWYDARVPYSQARMREGYRTDCSGFISMCWGLGTSYTTPFFANGTAHNEILSSYNDLVPADALVRRSSRSGHIVLFVGWNDRAHTEACVLEQMSTRDDMKFHVRTTSSLRSLGYRPVRADRLSDVDGDSRDDGDRSGEDDGEDDGQQ